MASRPLVTKTDSPSPDSFRRDADLIRRYRAGDQAAFERLVANHIGAVYSFVARYVGADGETEDVVQDVFIKVWKNIGRFDIERGFRTWLFAIAKNTALDWLKKKKPVAFSQLSSDDDAASAYEETIPADDLSPSDAFDRSVNQEALDAALAALPADHRAVVVLRLDSQLTFREIAEALEKPLNTVKSHYRRALVLLRQKLADRHRTH